MSQATTHTTGRDTTLQHPKIQRSWPLWVALGGVLVLYVYCLVYTAWLCDDSYITFRTVGNFVSGYGLTWNIGERVQAYTHPLWMFLLSGLFCATAGEPNFYYSVLIGSMALSLAAVLVYAFGIARTIPQAILGVTVLLFSKAFVDYSTSGLENPLSYLLLAVFLQKLLGTRDRAQGTADPQQPSLFALSLLASLLVLNRMDLILLVGPALLYGLRQSRRALPRETPGRQHATPTIPALNLLSAATPGRRAATPSGLQNEPAARQGLLGRAGVLLLGFVPFFAWEVFSVIYYGFPFPNTAYAKLNTGIPDGELLRQGLYYFANSLRQDPVTLPAIGCAVVAAVISRRGRHLALAVGLVLYVLYVLKIGGDFMGGRFFSVPLLVAVAILSTLDLHGWLAKVGWSAGMLGAVVLGLCAPNPSLATDGMYGHIGDGLVDVHGIADERGWYYIFTGLVRSNRKVGHVVLRDAKNARESGQKVVVSTNTIGLFGYNAGPDIHIIDPFALADPLLARLPMTPNPQWRIGHFERTLPAGYVESLRTDRNQIVDPQVRALYDDIVLITRGPLFSAERWGAIWRLSVTGAAPANVRSPGTQAAP